MKRFSFGFLLVLFSYFMENVGIFAHQNLTIEQRIKAQEAIERVYYEKRIWPKENPNPKPPFEEFITEEILRNKVEDYIKKSILLEEIWLKPITGEQLQAEIDRMVKNTRDPVTLKKLFEALGNDPYLIAETLARQTLADRLIRNWYSFDERFHGELKKEAENLRKELTIENFEYLGRDKFQRVMIKKENGAKDENIIYLKEKEFKDALKKYPDENQISEVEENESAFLIKATFRKNGEEIEAGIIAFEKEKFEEWFKKEENSFKSNLFSESKYNYQMSDLIKSDGDNCEEGERIWHLPEPRSRYSAIWTGSEMIVWGGYRLGSGYLNTGIKYNPSTDAWTSASTTNAPSKRCNHTAVWTGREMIVWGGYDGSYLNTGGRYNPSSDSWVETSAENAPSERCEHTALWTGEEMIICGGYVGSRYNPSTDSWNSTKLTNAPSAGSSHKSFWTGEMMILWEGSPIAQNGGIYWPVDITRKFNNLFPSDGANGQPTNELVLDWEDSAGATSYDLYFGAVSPPPLYQSNLLTSAYTLKGLSSSQTYYWYVVAKNSCGNAQGEEWSFTTNKFFSADLSYNSSTFTDSCSFGGPGHANGGIDPGETINLFITLKNNGTTGATGVSATISTTTPGVTITTNSATYPDIPANETKQSNSAYIFTVDHLIACETTINFTINISANEGTWSGNFQLSVGSTNGILFSENFDSATAPNLPAYWTSVVVNYSGSGSTPVWTTSSTTYYPPNQSPYSSPNLVGFNSYDAYYNSTARLQYNVPFNFSPFSAITLSFWMYHDTGYSSRNDRVQIQYSTDGTTWNNIGSTISRYDGSTGWKEHTVDLSALAGQANVYIGILGISSYGNDIYLDDIKITVYSANPICFECWCYTPPSAFNLLTPANGATNQPINNILLDWENSNYATAYDLYFGTTSPPPLYRSNLPASQYIINNLSLNTTYYWFVRAKSACGTQNSAEWSFTTICSNIAYGFAVNKMKKLVSFDLSTPGTFNTIGSFGTDAPFAADFLGNDYTKIYALDYNTNHLLTYRTTDAFKTGIGSANPVQYQKWTGMAEYNGTLYAISAHINCESQSYLYTINPTDASVTVIGAINGVGGCPINLGATPSGLLYTLSLVNDAIYRIDRTTASATYVGYVGFDANFAQGMDFDIDSGTMYLAAYNNSTSRGELRSLNLLTGESTLIGAFPNNEEVDGISIVSCSDCTIFPSAFNLISPLDSSIDQPITNLALDWQDSSNAILYNLYFGTTNPPPLYASITTSNYTITGPLEQNTTYYWYVEAVSVCGPKTTSTWSFTTCSLPGSFSLISPSNGGENQLINGLVLDWEDAGGATSYDLYLGTSSPPPLYQSNISTSQYTVNGLSANTNYRWFVKAKNICGNKDSSEWSFTTCSLPGSFSLISPANGASDILLTDILLDWNDTTGATTYNLYFGTASPPPLYQTGLTTSQFLIPTLTQNTTYYWYVEAVNFCGKQASSTWSFTTCSLPGNFSLITPPNGSIGQPIINISLDWQDSNNAIFYNLYFGATNPPPLYSSWFTSSNYFIAGPLYSNTTYYWYVEAVNDCGVVQSNSTHSFTTVTFVPPPQISYHSYALNEDICPTGGGGDHSYSIDPGETAYIGVLISNEATAGPLAGITGTLSTTTSGVTIHTNSSTFPDLFPGETIGSDNSFVFEVAETIPCGTNLQFSLTINGTDGNGNPYQTVINFSIEVGFENSCINCTPANPALSYFSHTFTDDCLAGGAGDGDSIADPGEYIDIYLTIQNTGIGNASGVSAIITTTTPNITIVNGSSNYPNISAGGRGTSLSAYRIYIAETVPCGTVISFNLKINSSQGSWTDSFNLNTGSVVINEGFENTAFPPSGWIIEKYYGGEQWAKADSLSHTGSASAVHQSHPTSYAEGWLITPQITIPSTATSPILSFWEYSDNGSYYYHGVWIYLESINYWIEVVELTNPQASWRQQIVDLSGYKGETIKLAFVYQGENSDDWYIDDVVVSYEGTTPQCNVCECSLPASFNLLTPQNAAVNQPSSLVLDWQDSNGASHYDLYFGTSSNPPLYQSNITQSQRSVSGLLNSTTYYWRVEAVNNCGETSTATWQFTTASQPKIVPDGSGATTPVIVKKNNTSGTELEISWDGQCNPVNANIIYGPLSGFSSYQITGSKCDISNSDIWNVGDYTNIWFLIVSDNGAGTESSWGYNSSGQHRNGTNASLQCGNNLRDNSGTCP